MLDILSRALRSRSHLIYSLLICLILAASARAQTDQSIYSDALQNNWENWGWAQINYDNAAPVYSGTRSVSVTAAAWQAVYLHHAQFSTNNYTSLSFRIHGGPAGGQQLQVQATVNGAAQPAVNLQPLAANSWQQITLSLASLGVGAGTDMDGFWIMDRSGASQPTFYLDDIRLVGGTPPPPPQNNPVAIQIDAAANRRPIDARIYGLNFATQAQLADLNVPVNRSGGNNTSRYNWQQNADNKGSDWYFESIAGANVSGEAADSFINGTKAGGAEPLITIPMLDWVAKVGPNREKLSSFSINKYGAQTGSDAQWFPDAGNGVRAGTNQPITGNDPNDANVPNSTALQQTFVQHLLGRWGASNAGGVRYYILDNEHSIWHATHRDVQPVGARMSEVFGKMRDYAATIKSVDPGAQVLGPEEWGWSGYLYSGYDLQWFDRNGFGQTPPDRAANGNVDYVPYLLQQFRQNEQQTGRRLLDVFTLHYYPQSNEFSNDTSAATQALRNRSTRSLWDANYTDQSWINDKVKLIPRMKQWVAQYYPGTKIGLTEYNWGAENHINGATAQADILGIMGREGLDLATRWTTPDASTPTYKAIKLYRNYDNNKSAFGDVSVAANAPNADQLSAFAAVRSADNALTIMVVNKVRGETPVTLNLSNYATNAQAGAVQVWQLTSTNQIVRQADASVSNNAIATIVPGQSISLFVIPGGNSNSALAAPSNLTKTLLRRKLGLQWQDNSSNEDGFIVERAVSPTAGTTTPVFTTAARVGANQTFWQTFCQPGSFQFRVRATRGSEISNPSNVITVTIR